MTYRVQQANSASFCNSLMQSSDWRPDEGASRRDWNRHLQETKKNVFVQISFINLGWSRVLRRSILLCCVGVFLCFDLTAARGQVLSRPAAVLLIARVESVGVSARPDDEPGQSETDPGLDAERLMIKTSWAVPPNFTRLRLIRSITCESNGVPPRNPRFDLKSNPKNVDKMAPGSGGISCLGSSAWATDAAFRSSSELLWNESSGSTNQAKAREVRIQLPGRKDDVLRKSSGEPIGTITLVLEAF